jgi:glucoamylase
MDKAKIQSTSFWYDSTVAYWLHYLEAAAPAPDANEAVRELYERSLLTMKLMAQHEQLSSFQIEIS